MAEGRAARKSLSYHRVAGWLPVDLTGEGQEASGYRPRFRGRILIGDSHSQPVEVPMFLAIVGAALVGCIGLAALYDHFARRRGRNESFGSSEGTPSFTAYSEHNYPNP